MKHNTGTLGYKLLSGSLRKSRKNSEQLNKYLSGLIDADGCASLVFRRCDNKFSINLTFSLVQSFSNDPDGSLLRSLKEFYNIGTITYRNLDNFSSISEWRMGSKEFLALFNLIGKHLRIKGTHFDNLIWTYLDLKGCRLSSSNIEELKEFSKCSRLSSRWLKHPKHLSYSWLAGYFDGDGHYRLRSRKKFIKSYGKECNANELAIQVSCDTNDSHIIDKIISDVGGHKYLHKQGHTVWKISIGKNSSIYALKLLKQMRKYSCLEKKYSIIEQMILFHENHQQRLNKGGSKE